MKYFNIIPVINYGNLQIVNLFYRYEISGEIDTDFIFSYNISNDESLEDIALKYYNNPQLWWVIALINDINDVIFEIPLSDEIIRDMARIQATTYYTEAEVIAEYGPLPLDLPDQFYLYEIVDGIYAIVDQDKFISYYDTLSDVNDEKRIINILSPDYINEFLSRIIKLSEKHNFVDRLSNDITYSDVDVNAVNVYMNDDTKLIDKEGSAI